jgi:hypothetical protein
MASTGFCPGCGAPTTPSTELCWNCGAQVAEAPNRKTWKPTAAGIICIIVGGLFGIPCLLYVSAALIGGAEGWREALYFGALILIPVIPVAIGITGGIYALKRRIWGLVLAGCISTLALEIAGYLFLAAALSEGRGMAPTWWLALSSMIFGLPGILAIIFVSLGKREFK